LHIVGILFPHINDDARSESLQNLLLPARQCIDINTPEENRFSVRAFRNNKKNTLSYLRTALFWIITQQVTFLLAA